MTESEDFCRDYLRGNCSRGFKCRYRHPDAAEVAARAVSTGLDVGRTVFCRDFQKGMCTRENCKFVHATEAEELYYKLTGQMPPRLQSTSPPEVTPNSQLHQLMLNACLTGDYTAYTHQLQVMGYTVAPMAQASDAVGMHGIMPGYLHQQVGVPPSPGSLSGPMPGVGMHPSYSPLPGGLTPPYQPSYSRMPSGHGGVGMPLGGPRQGIPRRQPYTPVLVSAGIQTPRLSTLPPLPSSSTPSAVPSPGIRPQLVGDTYKSDPAAVELLGTEGHAQESLPTSSVEKALQRNGTTGASFTPARPGLLEDLQMKLEETERRVRKLEHENEVLREENAKLKGRT